MITNYDYRAGSVNATQETRQAIVLDTTVTPEYVMVYLNGDLLDSGLQYLLVYDNDKITVKFLDNCPISIWDSYYIRWAYL